MDSASTNSGGHNKEKASSKNEASQQQLKSSLFGGLTKLENIIHDVGGAVGSTLHNIEDKAAHLADDIGDNVENVLDDVHDNLEDAYHKIGDKVHFGLGGVEVKAQNLVADTANHISDQLNARLGLGFGRVEKLKVETQEERDEKLKDLKAKVALENEKKKKEDDKRRRRSSANSASSRRAMMFSEANEEESSKEAKADMFMDGKGSIWKTTTEQMGEMGIGIQLYFQISKILSVSFLLMTLCHIPTMYLNAAGNNGHALNPDLMQSFSAMALKTSLANQGFSWDTVEEPDCESNGGEVDCTGMTVDIFGSMWEAEKVSETIMICEFLAGVVFIVTCGACILVVEKLEAQVDDENAEPEDFGVFVRGLPADVTLQELIDHFSPVYALDKETPYYPSKLTPFGLSIRRATKYFWWWLLFISPFVAWFVGAVTDDPAKGAFGGLWSGLIIVVDFAWTNYTQKGNKPTMRKSPVVLYDDEETARREKAKAKKAKQKVKKEKAKEKMKKLTGSAKIYAEGQQKKKDDDEEENKEEEVYDPEKDAFRPNPRPVADCSNTGNKIYLNSWIAEISLVHPTGGVITKFKDKEKSLKRMKVREVKLQKRGAENAGPKEERKLIAAKQRMEAKTKRLSESVKPENANDVIAAFVIFNCEESRNRCLEDYSETGNWFFRYFQAKKFNMVKNGVSYKLRVESAPTPGLIFWENLQLDDLERFARGVFTAIVTTALLLISFALIYVTNLYATAASDALPETTLCQSIIPTIVQGNRSFDEGIKYVHNKTLSESVCGAGGAHIALEGYDYDHLHPFHVDFKETPESEKVKQVVERSEVKGFFEDILAGNHSEQEVFEYKLCDSVCLNTSATENDMCGSLGCQLNVYENGVRTGVNNESEVFHDYECNTYSATMLQACYCQQRMDEMVAVKGIGAWSEMKDPDGEGPLCAEFADNFFNAQILAMAGALFIVVINLVLKEIARALVKVEKHPNASSASRALVMKITAAQFLNTAMIGLLMNAQLNQSHKDFFGYEGTPFEKYGLLDGNYQDFYREWFATVGTSLCLTMLANIIVPHVGPFAKGIFARPAKIKVLRKHAATKVEMDELYAMDRFEIETRYGALLNYLMVSVLYAAGMPLLFLFASFNFFIAFWLDKYALLRLNKQPLKYNSALAQMMSRYLIPLAVVLHLSFTCYIYSTPAVTEIPSTTGISVVSGLIFDLPEKGKDLKTGELVSSVLVSSPLNGMARDIVEQMAGSHFVLDDLLPRVVRSNVFPLMVLMGAFLGLYIIVSIFGDVLMAFAKLVLMEVILKAADVGKNVAGKVGEQAAKARDEAKKAAEAAADVGKMAGKMVIDKAAEAGKMATGVDGREIAARGMEGLNEARNRALSLTDKVSGIMEEKVPFEMPKLTMAAMKNSAQPDFTAIYEPMMTAMQARHYRKHGRLNDHDHDMGFRGTEDLKCHCIWTEDCVSEDGVQHKSGRKKKTWEVIRGMGIHNYNIEENKLYDLAVSFMIESNIHVENEHRNIAGGRQNRMKAVAKAVFKFKGWKSRKSKREKAETAKSIAIGVEKGVEEKVEEKVEERVEDEHEPNDEDLKDLMEKPMTMELQAM